MNKKLIYLVAVSATIIGLSNFTALKTANASSKNQTVTVYKLKNHKLQKIGTKQVHEYLQKTAEVTVNHKKYYFSSTVQGIVKASAFKYAKATAGKPNRPNHNNNTSNNQSSQSTDQIVDGFNETTSTVVDQNAYINAFKNYMIQNINNYRQSQGLQPLTLDTGKLEDIAMTRAQQVYSNPVHVDSNGNIIVKQMLQDAGINYSIQSENLISGGLTESEYFANAKDSADGVLQNWLDEKADNGGHYQNLVNPNEKSIGIGIYIGPNNGLRTKAGYVEDYIG